MKFFVPAMAVFLLLSQTLLAQTSVPGGFVYGTWTLSGSPYNVQGAIQIPNDSTLTIQPGVVVSFQGTYKLVVLGRLLAVGTVVDSITFVAANTGTGWRGIRFDSTLASNDTSRISFCKLQYGKTGGSGNGYFGGALFFNGFSKAVITNNRISNNSTTGTGKGGGIYCSNASNPRILNNSIFSNTASSGGGIFIETSSPVISQNIIRNNTGVQSGGGITCSGTGSAVISYNTINNNISQNTNGYGGGVYVISGSPTLSYNSIHHNTVDGFGGGICCSSGSGKLISNGVSNNTAIGNGSCGGGIYLETGLVKVVNNTITNNASTGTGIGLGGGGIFINFFCNDTIMNNTIANNYAAQDGGGVYCINTSNPILRNDIIWGNTTSGTGPQVYLYDEPSDPKIYYCDIEGGTATFGLNGNFYSGTYQNNININPLFMSPSGGSGTGFNGVIADWSLQNNSPSVNTGDPVNYNYPTLDKAGNARVTICRIDQGAYEFQNGVPMSASFSQVMPLCFGDSNGSITIAVSGGNAPYTYSWNNGQTDETATGLSAGTYTVLVTEASGCTLSATVNLFQPTPLSNSFSTVNASCNLVCNGALTVTASGGTAPYSYSWSSGCTIQSCSGLCTGVYTVVVTDANGCSISPSSGVGTDPAMTASFSNTSVLCNGNNDGTSSVSITNGTSPYTYSWSNGGTTQTATGLMAMNYSVTVTDANGCSGIFSTTISEPALLNVSTSVIAQASCFNNDGGAGASAVGGTAPYSYSWSNTATTQNISNLGSGTYTVVVTDANGCMDSATVAITNSIALPAPSVCMVTVDSFSQYNVIMWDKTAYTTADSFIVYREISTNNYQPIAAVSNDSLSLFVDTVSALYFPNTGDPNSGTYRYKLQVLDTCGNYSPLGPYHNTIFISNNAGNFTWAQLYTIEGGPNPVNNYVLYRDDLSNGNWQQVNSVAGTQQNVSDPNYSTWQATASWRVQTVWNISCNPTFRTGNSTLSTYATSYSNTVSNPNSVNEIQLDKLLNVFPNPGTGVFNIQITVKVVSASVLDVLGNEVYSTQDLKGSVDISALSDGLYLLRVYTEHGIAEKRIVKGH